MSNNSIGKSAIHLTSAKVLTTLLALVSSMLLSRFRTVEEYGTYSQMIITITLATSLFMLGLPNSTNYFLALAETKEERHHFLSVYYSFSTILCMMIGAVLVAALPLIEGYFKNDTIHHFAFFLAIYPWAHISIVSVSNVMVVYGKTVKLMAINIATTAVSLLSVLLIRILNLTFTDYIIAFLAGNVLIAVWIYWIVNHLDGRLSFSMDRKWIRKILAYSIPIGLASVVGTFTVEIDKLMIGHLVDTEGLAYYSNAGKELPLAIVSSALTAVLLPQMARKLKANDADGAVALWGEAVKLSYMIICFFAAACVAFAPQVMTFLYSEKYLPGVSVFRVYSLVLLLRCTYFGMALSSSGKTKLILWSSIASLVLNIILNYLLYLLLGFIGPAVASFLSIFLVNLAQLLFSGKLLGISFPRIFPWKSLGKITAINAIWAMAAYGVVQITKLGTSTRDVAICIGIGLVFTVLYAFFMKNPALSIWRKLNAEKV